MNVIVGRCEHGIPVAFCADDSSVGFKLDILTRYRLERVSAEDARITACHKCSDRIDANRALLEDKTKMGRAVE